MTTKIHIHRHLPDPSCTIHVAEGTNSTVGPTVTNHDKSRNQKKKNNKQLNGGLTFGTAPSLLLLPEVSPCAEVYSGLQCSFN